MQIDRRQPRVILDQPVTLMPPDGLELHGRIRNLSQGGAYIVDLDQQPKVRSQVHVAFALPHGPDVEAEATVLRTVPSGHPEEPEGIAVRFEDDDPGALAAFIREALGPGGEASNKVRLKLDTHGGVVITARERVEKAGMVTVECDLPFLCIGSGVHLQRGAEDELHTGTLSWVSAQTPPGSAYPRIHLGIRLHTDNRDDPTPDLIPATPSGKRQEPTELVEATLPHPLLEPRRTKRPRLAWRWLLPTILGGLLVGGAIVVGVHYSTNRGADAIERPLPPVRAEAPKSTALKPVEPRLEPEEPLEPPTPAPVAVPLAFATGSADEDAAVARRKRRARADLRRVRRADPKRLGIRRLLYRARLSLRRGKLDSARRYLLRVLAKDPSNERAAELMRRVLRKKKKTRPNT